MHLVMLDRGLARSVEAYADMPWLKSVTRVMSLSVRLLTKHLPRG